MAKKSKRRPLRYEKDQTSCISGLISIFDFRHGRSTRKMLADRRRGSRQAIGAGSSHTKIMLQDSRYKCQDTEDDREGGMASADTVKTSVKKLMEEEMFIEEGPEINASGVSPETSNPANISHARKNRKRTNKACKKSNDFNLCDMDAVKETGPAKACDRLDSQKTSDKVDFEIIMHLLHDNVDMLSDQASAFDEGKLHAALKIFIDQSLSNIKHSREGEQIQKSREFVDALHGLSSNKDLLLKFLQDPSSQLVKQIKGLDGAQLKKDLLSDSVTRSGFLEEKLAHSKTDELINHKPNRNFFRRRCKSQESFPSMVSEKCQSSSKIVILKPGPAAVQQQNTEINVSTSTQTHYHTGDKIQGERSLFSFTEIKRKLKHAIRKERQGISPDGITHKTPFEHHKRRDFDKGVGGENVGWRSPNRNHFYTERFAKPSICVKRGDKIGKLNDTEAKIVKETSEYTNPGVSSIYLEAKKHLLEMLSSGEEDAGLMSQQLPKSLGRILSFSEYNYSPDCSPRKGSEDSSVSAQRALSPPRGIEIIDESTDKLVQENFDDHSSPLQKSLEIKSCGTHVSPDENVESLEVNRSLSCEQNLTDLDEKTLFLAGDATITEGGTGIEETTKPDLEDNESPNAACKSSSSYSTGDGQNGDVPEECHEDSSTRSLEMESFGECEKLSSPSASPSHSSVTIKVEDFEGAIERTERPSPVSVLESLFVEDDVSPARTVSRPVHLEIQPRQIHFEEGRSSNDQGICMHISLGDEESAFEYVEAVLLGSGLIWDEYLLSWLSSSPILDMILYDEVELFSSRSRHEQKLLFDCTNEVLEEVCDRYFGCFQLMTSNKQNIRPVPTRMNLIHEIWEGVEWHLLQYPSPQSLDQLLKKDMGKSRTWMELRLYIQYIGTEMEEAILDKLVEDTISSFMSDARESDFLPSSAELSS